MKETPILFRPELTEKILRGEKTETRRPVLARHVVWEPGVDYGSNWRFVNRIEFDPIKGWECYRDRKGRIGTLKMPYGFAGNRLWVKCRWTLGHEIDEPTKPLLAVMHAGEEPHRMGEYAVKYPDAPEGSEKWAMGWKRKPSIHMPRWASPATLALTGVRVERLWDIDDAAIAAEGFAGHEDAGVAFAKTWDEINAIRGFGWDDNPWTWVLTFKMHEMRAKGAA